MIDFYQQMATELAQGAVVLATVTQVIGSAPRELGAKMLVCPGGKLIGTIGGGAGEARACDHALRVLVSGEKQFVEIDLSGNPQRETQGVCGGRMQVWLERWPQESLPLVRQILQSLESHQAAALVTPFQAGASPYLLPSTPVASIQVTDESLIEPLTAPPTLLIVGAGHVAVPLACMAQMAGFQVIVTDDRPEFATSERFSAEITVLAAPITQALNSIPPQHQLYAALVTRGYLHDLEPLQLLLQRSTRYIGMIGSRKRVQRVQQALLEAGYPPAQLDQLYAPIGLDIGALTPEEIAISICAELIQVRRGGSGNPLSQRSRPQLADQSDPGL